ncbi:hypothetical protein AKJ63_01855 [candidate division MSBL1 archaeon SCGC-AAA259D18]|uniref:DUF429 domain-containing protein n=1 Tax=candidate division MSBL1 archaeon SCGC-AAA259D18 TaxID=1698262 RepID=A0A133UAD7_9EURY|nr:hypothetical protein AKJ63_01855 [candidate division MSBL1 archaeon SCGC-AAA259D18]
MKTLGIDLAGKVDNPSGVAVLEESSIRTDILNSDEEIIDICKSQGSKIIAIDAPLSFPEKGNLREADSELIRRGHRVLPPTLGGMRPLTERGIRMARELCELEFEVIEVHPRTSGKILFGSESRDEWVSKLREGDWNLSSGFSEHEIDSIVAAVTGFLYLEDRTEEVGEQGEGIVIPKNELKTP